MSLTNLVPRVPGCCQEWGLQDSKGRLEIVLLPGLARPALGSGLPTGFWWWRSWVLPEFRVLEFSVPNVTPGIFYFILRQSFWHLWYQSLTM